MKDVIVEYEDMLSEQLVQLECNCGKTLFDGILIPKNENICICPSCNEKYKVLVSYDSILITDTLNDEDIFDKITKSGVLDMNKTLE